MLFVFWLGSSVEQQRYKDNDSNYDADAEHADAHIFEIFHKRAGIKIHLFSLP
jgi:hypothetical protein